VTQVSTTKQLVNEKICFRFSTVALATPKRTRKQKNQKSLLAVLVSGAHGEFEFLLFYDVVLAFMDHIESVRDATLASLATRVYVADFFALPLDFN
jgi:hypothetical protein